MKYIVIILTFLMFACEPVPPQPIKNNVIAMKNCMHVCMSSTFEMFHHQGSNWGTGSSSMNGLSQEKIFDRVVKYCEEFYKEEKCCQYDYRYRTTYKVNKIHSYEYGACQENET